MHKQIQQMEEKTLTAMRLPVTYEEVSRWRLSAENAFWFFDSKGPKGAEGDYYGMKTIENLSCRVPLRLIYEIIYLALNKTWTEVKK